MRGLNRDVERVIDPGRKKRRQYDDYAIRHKVRLGTPGEVTGLRCAAALVGARNNEDVGYASLGAHIATSFAVFNGMQLTPRASAAWQYAFGDVTPTAALAFQRLGTGFTVAGVPLARSSVPVQGGLPLRVTPAGQRRRHVCRPAWRPSAGPLG